MIRRVTQALTRYTPTSRCLTASKLKTSIIVSVPIRTPEITGSTVESGPKITPQVPSPIIPPPTTKMDVAAKHTPWPFTLPLWLQPKVGTTYYATYSTDAPTLSIVMPASLIQRVLYGVPESDSKVEVGIRSREENLWHKIMHGVPDPQPPFRKKVTTIRDIVKP